MPILDGGPPFLIRAPVTLTLTLTSSFGQTPKSVFEGYSGMLQNIECDSLVNPILICVLGSQLT